MPRENGADPLADPPATSLATGSRARAGAGLSNELRSARASASAPPRTEEPRGKHDPRARARVVSYVVATRQSSVLFAIAIGAVRWRERPSRLRLLGAFATIAGVALVARSRA